MIRGLKCLWVLLAGLPSGLLAQETIGVVKALKGEVAIERAAVKRPARAGDALLESDRITTAAASHASLSLRDQSSIALGPHSEVDLRRYRFDPVTHQGEQQVRLGTGSLASISGKIAKASPDAVRFNAATMTLGVRGTRFIADLAGTTGASDPGSLRDGQGRIVRSAQGLCWQTGAFPRSCPVDRYVLLPDPDGKVGEIRLEGMGLSVVLDRAYAGLDIDEQGARRVEWTEAQVRAQYGPLLEALPPAAQTFVLRFEAGSSSRLTPESESTLAGVQRGIANWPSIPSVDVIGHTDTVGAAAVNDALSLERARTVSRRLDALSLPSERLQVSGRGERQLLVQTPDETDEPANRRVEITVY